MVGAFLPSLFPLSILSPKRVGRMPFQSGLLKLLCFLFISGSTLAQPSNDIGFLKPSDTLNTSRRTSLYISETVVLGTALVGLNQLWYKDYKQSSFHFVNDNDNWLQMDKLGHVYSSYQIGRFGAESLRWSGASQKEQLIYGATLGLGFLSVVEVFDGFSQEWGASSGDVLANISGTALYVSQELLWNEQRIVPKFSFHKTQFPALRPSTLGATPLEQVFKDYNGQNYWLSFNLHSFTKLESVPKWLNLAVGYGATGMVYATNAVALENNIIQSPYRQFYLSLDVDLTKIKTNSNVLKTFFSVFNSLKVPAPTLEFGPKTKLRAYAFYY